MLKLELEAIEIYDEKTQTFATTKPQTIKLEHSLVSISKWESKWKRPFLSKEPKTSEQSIDYIRCMSISGDIDDSIIGRLSEAQSLAILEYIDSDMTATKLPKNNKTGVSQVVTSELIYYWMIQHNVPFECEKWHLNRLLTLINVCSIKASPPKKMSKQELARRNSEINAARKRQLNTGG